ncbi:hypothetical protein [Devosia sp.]|uniref:hypothetical protein n=1 Tax=Devosia sp. TaxID=1871048 RepID=UPI001AC4D9FF|nr:hypothetical protein [Devosia sp.]MBN9334685.1 hypothetical protein [Devosia sp.]
MALNSQPASARLKSGIRLMREFRARGTMSLADFDRLDKVLADVTGDVEQMELAAGTAPITTQLKAAGSDIVALKRILAQPNAGKAVRRG